MTSSTHKKSYSQGAYAGLMLCMLVILLKAVLLVVGPTAIAANGQKLVIFTAQWSAKSRDVTPIVQSVAQQTGASLQQIDVDAQNAPNAAKALGLTIPTTEPPQVYLIHQGQAQLLLDGKSYNYSNANALKTQLLNQINK